MIYNGIIRVLLYLLFIFLIGCNSENKASWEKIPVDGITNYTINSVDFLDEENGLVIANLRGSSKIYQTKNGGMSWHQTFEVDQGLHDVKFVNSTKVVAVGNEDVWVSPDAGKSWDSVNISISDPLIAVVFNNNRAGFAVGMNGVIFKSTDGGETWEKQESGSSSFLRDVDLINDTIAYAVGFGGTILKTDNGGESWKTLQSSHDGNLSAVGFLDTETGFAVGQNGTILQTNDGGTTWNKRETGIDSGLLGIDLYEDSGIITGFGGTIISSEDAGKSWEIASRGEFPHLYDAFMMNGDTIFLVGDEGTILKKI